MKTIKEDAQLNIVLSRGADDATLDRFRSQLLQHLRPDLLKSLTTVVVTYIGLLVGEHTFIYWAGIPILAPLILIVGVGLSVLIRFILHELPSAKWLLVLKACEIALGATLYYGAHL